MTSNYDLTWIPILLPFFDLLSHTYRRPKMPSPKNLIAIKQIRQDELSGFALTVASGYVQSYVSGVTGELLTYINLVSGNLQDYTDTASGTLQDGLDDLQDQIDG